MDHKLFFLLSGGRTVLDMDKASAVEEILIPAKAAEGPSPGFPAGKPGEPARLEGFNIQIEGVLHRVAAGADDTLESLTELEAAPPAKKTGTK